MCVDVAKQDDNYRYLHMGSDDKSKYIMEGLVPYVAVASTGTSSTQA